MPAETFPSVGPYSPEELTADLNASFTDHQGQINALDTRLDAAEATIISLDSRLDAAEPTLVSLDSRVDALEAASGGININRVINGCFRVDQRNSGASQTITAGAALAYTLDRWYAYCTGANVTVQRITTNNNNRLRFTGAASNTGVGLGQRIEAANCFDLAGGAATLQVKLSSSSLTSVGWAVYYANTTDSFGTLASPTRTLVASGTFTITSTEATYSVVLSSIPTAANTGLEIVFTGGALLGSQTLTIGDVKLERGSTVTAFECRPIQQELAMCQRYFIRMGNSENIGSSNSTTACQNKAFFPVEMRAGAVATLRTGTTISVDFFGIGSSTSTVYFLTPTTKMLSININTLSPSRTAFIPTSVTSEIDVSAEL